MRTVCFGICLILLIPTVSLAQLKDKVADRLWESNLVIDELLKAPDSDLPISFLKKAQCVAVIPALKKLAFGFGGRYGRGAVSCRKDEGKGPWGPPSMIALSGGSFGFQIGGQSTDVVMLFMTSDSTKYLLRDKVTFGGDVSAAVGPIGRNASAETSTSLKAEILSYSRSRGLFAGIALKGAVLKPDKSANESLYGKTVTAAQLFDPHNTIAIPDAAKKFVDMLSSASSGK